MSRKLTQKVIEAGLVPEHAIKLMKMWRCLESDLPEGESTYRTQQQLLEFVDEIAVLLESELEAPEMRETYLSLWQQFQRRHKDCWLLVDETSTPVKRQAMKDAAGKIILWWLESTDYVFLGTFIRFEDKTYQVIDVETTYSGESPECIVTTVVEVNSAEMPQLLEADEK